MTSKTARAWLGAAAAIAATGAGTVVLVRLAPLDLAQLPVAATGWPHPPQAPGILAAISAGDASVTRRLPAAAFSLRPGETLDLRLPPGPFDAKLEVTFEPGAVRRAQVGAEIEGAALVIERAGEVVAAGKAGDGPVTVMSPPLYLPGPASTITFRLRASRAGAGEVRFRGLWQPEGTAMAVPLPPTATAREPADLGYSLVRELNCATCHESADPALQAALGGAAAPHLGRVGARARAGWMRRWIAGPSALKPDARMPALLDPAADAESIEDLVHFLVGMGGPLAGDAGSDAGLAETGRALYHRIGCAACHGALDPPAPSPHAHPLDSIGAKTTASSLSAFLADPVAVRPGGEMPAQGLSALEAEAIAAYLMETGGTAGPAAPGKPWHPDPARVERGARLFAEAGCASCHSLGGGLPEIETELAAAPLESLWRPGTAPGGCLAEDPAHAPDYGLSSQKRAAIAAFLETLPQRRSADVPHLRLASDLDRLHCLACHSIGPAGGPGARLRPLFATRLDVDLGDEGRLPPDLHDAGARLDPEWLSAVLLESGTARPWMATRMPQYGAAAAGGLAGLLVAAAGADAEPDPGPAGDAEAASIGRSLAGSSGFNCVQCHAVDGNQAALPGVDLAEMPRRLRYGHFARVLHDPKAMNPGTRMPGFFSGGRSGLVDRYDGDAARQIEAIWSYLARASTLALPEGLAGADSFALEPQDRPIVFRTFMKDVGPRAIACGVPEGIHAAFDADSCALRLVWTGRFLDAAGAWASRGGSETNPSQAPAWTAPQAPGARRFRGYRLDAGGMPIFEYDVEAGGTLVRVSEQPVPRRDGDGAWLERRFELRGPAGAVVDLSGAGGPADLRLDASGRAAFTAEVRW